MNFYYVNILERVNKAMNGIISKLRDRISYDNNDFYFFLSLGAPHLIFLFSALCLNGYLAMIALGVDVLSCFIWTETEDGFDIGDFLRNLFMMLMLNFAFIMLGALILCILV